MVLLGEVFDGWSQIEVVRRTDNLFGRAGFEAGQEMPTTIHSNSKLPARKCSHRHTARSRNPLSLHQHSFLRLQVLRQRLQVAERGRGADRLTLEHLVVDQPLAYFPDVAVDVTSHLPDLTGGDDRFNISAFQLHREFRTADGGSCSITATRRVVIVVIAHLRSWNER